MEQNQNYMSSLNQGQYEDVHENTQAYNWPHIDQSYGAYYSPLIPKAPPQMMSQHRKSKNAEQMRSI